ncbi:SGNH/GDSL hydrolase family protein [Singulisphaera rosea]
MVTMTRRCVMTAFVFALIPLGPFPSASAAKIGDYLALGDSMAFGETDFSANPSNGDRGYVSLYADSLAQSNGGVRPHVINLAADGETSSTFFNGGANNDGTPGHPGSQWNLNYSGSSQSQNSLMLSTIAAEKASGHEINTVTIQIGANDLLAALGTPGFLNMPLDQQQAAIGQGLAMIAANDKALLTELNTLLPNVNLIILGYHNPFNADPTSAIGRIADPAIKALNALIAGEAATFGAKYVDTYAPFLGHELSYTYIASGNVHPNAAGYAVIASRIETVPEPSSVLIGAGILGWIAAGRFPYRRRRVASSGGVVVR